MPNRYDDPYDPQSLRRIRMFVYLVPVIGVFPAVWALYQRQGDRRERAAGRLAVTLGLAWILSYYLLAAGAHASTGATVPLLITSSVMTSGYFVVNLWLMLRLWQRKPVRLPGLSDLGDRLLP